MTHQSTTATVRCRCICPNGCNCGCTCLAAIELRAEQKARRDANGGPIRIQRRRTPGWRKPEGAVYVGRPTRFANPARIVRADRGLTIQWGATGRSVGTYPADGVEARRYATELYRSWLDLPEQADTCALFRALLHGRDLTCWCPLPAPGEPDHCHAAVLLELASGIADTA
ncbi:DUF4326 domain-containing protein [Streptomyces sp. NPDC058001]|uniref:DUF4326 domain-containing protein n=1 Tax=Streptomyces sp. NPDC058001 TaxID=3346300 RepID=UPI0036E78869